MSLADELLADLEEDDNDAELLLMEKQQQDDEKRANDVEMEAVRGHLLCPNESL